MTDVFTKAFFALKLCLCISLLEIESLTLKSDVTVRWQRQNLVFFHWFDRGHKLRVIIRGNNETSFVTYWHCRHWFIDVCIDYFQSFFCSTFTMGILILILLTSAYRFLDIGETYFPCFWGYLKWGASSICVTFVKLTKALRPHLLHTR